MIVDAEPIDQLECLLVPPLDVRDARALIGSHRYPNRRLIGRDAARVILLSIVNLDRPDGFARRKLEQIEMSRSRSPVHGRNPEPIPLDLDPLDVMKFSFKGDDLNQLEVLQSLIGADWVSLLAPGVLHSERKEPSPDDKRGRHTPSRARAAAARNSLFILRPLV